MTDELKECPFCGGEPQELHHVAPKGTVCCLKCSAYTMSTSDWNTRTKQVLIFALTGAYFSGGYTFEEYLIEGAKKCVRKWHLTAKE